MLYKCDELLFICLFTQESNFYSYIFGAIYSLSTGERHNTHSHVTHVQMQKSVVVKEMENRETNLPFSMR